MRLIDTVFSMLMISLLFSGILGFGKIYGELDLKTKSLTFQNDSLKFISESFENTCRGKGFSSLNEWQKVCGALWKLDYIGWSKADSFLPLCESSVLYGTWRSSLFNGEVYCDAGVLNEESN